MGISGFNVKGRQQRFTMKRIFAIFIVGVILFTGCRPEPRIYDSAASLGNGYVWRYPRRDNFNGSVCFGEGAAYFSENGFRDIRSVGLDSGASRWTHSFGEYYTYLLNYSGGIVLCESITQKSNYQQDSKTVLSGLDHNTGKVLFSIEIPRVGESIARIGTVMAIRSNPYLKDSTVFWGTSYGYIYGYDIRTCELIFSHRFRSAPGYGPFEWKDDLFWVLESGSIVKLHTSKGEFEEILSIDKRNYCFGAVLSADGTLLCGYDKGKMALYDLNTGNTVWEKSISRSTIRVGNVQYKKAFIESGVDILEISLEDGSTIREAPFEGLSSQVFEIPQGYLFNMGRCMVIADHDLQPLCVWYKSGYEDLYIKEDVLFYVYHGLNAVRLDSLCVEETLR
jgi:outer membrane protein assembly factor BamB